MGRRDAEPGTTLGGPVTCAAVAASGPAALTVRGGDALLGAARFERSDLELRGGRIEAVGARPRRGVSLDAHGLLVAPGFLDAQCNGAFGIDLAAAPERVGELAERLPATGVTSWCPTLVTAPPDRVGRLLATLAADHSPGARFAAAAVALTWKARCSTRSARVRTRQRCCGRRARWRPGDGHEPTGSSS